MIQKRVPRNSDTSATNWLQEATHKLLLYDLCCYNEQRQKHGRRKKSSLGVKPSKEVKVLDGTIQPNNFQQVKELKSYGSSN